MADRTPIVLNGEWHAPLASGDTLPGTVVRVSAEAGNALSIGADGGLQVTAGALAAALRTCAGLAHVAGAAVPTCQEMSDAIAAAIGGIPQDQFLQLVNFDPVTHTLTFTLSEGGEEFTVDLSELLPVVVNASTGLTGDGTVATPLALSTPEATPPAITQGTDLPTNLIGGRAQLLGQPDGWMTVNGRKLPYWN